MTQGVSLSLNLALARMSAIENNFAILQGFSPVKSANQEEIQTDFKTILDAKINEAEINKNPVEDEVSIESALEFSEDIDLSKKEINLKDKIGYKTKNTYIDELIDTFSEKYNIDSNFIKAIVKQESGFNANATSKKGAMGLMQLMPKTAKSLGINDAYNPSENLEGGIRYLKGLLDNYDGNKELALAAYNAGSSTVKKYGGIPPYKETQNYVNSIMSAYSKIKEANL